MDDSQIAEYIKEYRQTYPPLITFEQAATIAQLPLKTVYDYSHRKLFEGFKHKIGRHCLLDLACFVEFLLTPRETISAK